MIDKFFGQYRWLSNFAPVTVELDGELYPSVEHAYQAAKTLRGPFFRGRIQNAATPAEAKQLGKKVPVRADWDVVKLDIMLNLLRQKFSVPYYRQRLVATGDEELVEGNAWGDTFWGVCRGVGENHLGKLLMQVRTECRS